MPISGENDKFALVRCEGDAQWLEQRAKGVGGSDVAAIMGLSPWRTPAQVWLEKTGRTQPEDLSGKPYVEFGNIMEPLIGKWYAERHPGRTVRRVNAVCQSMARPWAQASLDYEVKDGDWGVLEIKTARTAADWQDGVPPYYLTQVVHYMTVTDRPFADVAVFFRDTCEFAEFRVGYDAEDGAAVMGAVDSFWNDYVKADVMPELAGTDGEARALTSMYGPATADLEERFDAETDCLIAQYQAASEMEKAAKADKQAASTKLMGIIGEHKGLLTDVARVTWVRSRQRRFDAKAFAADFPELYERYCSECTRNGGLRIKELA